MYGTKIQKLIFSGLVLFLSACGGDSNDTHTVKVYKPDGSKQCGTSGIPVETMRLDLAREGIDVICAQKTDDGGVRTAVCGAETGAINVYLINRSNIPDADKLGFKPVSELKDYKDTKCIN